MIEPRAMSRTKAAVYLDLEAECFDEKVKAGILPRFPTRTTLRLSAVRAV